MKRFHLTPQYKMSISLVRSIFTAISMVSITFIANAQAPTTGATNFSVTNIEGDNFRVNWTRGNGARVLVIASTSATFNGSGVPADGTDYVPNANFGAGGTIGAGNFVVYEGTATNVTVNNLVHSTTYYFRIYEFNGTTTATQYNTAAVLAGQGTTLFPPTVGSSAMVTTPTGNSVSLSWTAGNGTRRVVILQQGSSPGDPVNYVNYTASTTFGSGTAIGSGRVVYFNTASSVTVTNLQPNTTYFFKVVEANGTSNSVFDPSTALTGSFVTGGAPNTGATAFSVSNVLGNSVRVNWTRGDGSNVLVVASLSPTFNGSGVPVNGTDYVENAAFGTGDQIGTGNFVVYRNTGTNVTVTGLVLGTTYYFRIYEFNGTNFNTVYNTTAVLAGNGSTLSPPTTGSSNLVATPTGNTASLTWTRGNGTRCILILQTGSIPGDPVQYQNYTASATFGSGSAIGTGRVVYFNTGNSVNVTNLQPNTQYFYKLIESNGPGGSGSVYDLTNALTGSFLTAGAPTVGGSAFSATSIDGDRFSISFTSGNGTRRLIVARQDVAVDWVPTNGVDYNVSSVFGNGDNLGNNTFAVGETTSSSLTITGLTPATTYHIAVFEYNGTATNTIYLTTAGQILRGNATTVSPPSTSASALAFSNITGYSANFTFTAGNGVRRIILVRAGAAVTDVPVNLVNYSGSSNFAGAPVLGSSRIILDGTATSGSITALQPNTTYHFAIFEYNGNTSPVYKQVDPAIGSFVTLGKPTVSPSALTFSSLQGDRFTLNYTSGNGFGRIIVAKQGSPVDAFPADFTSYTASGTFGSGADLGGGNFVIDNNPNIGGNSSTSVSGLAIGQTYHFAVIEYNGTGTQRIYMTPAEALTGNQSTLSAPTVQASNMTFTNITANSATITWQNGNGNARLVLIRQGAAVTSLPANLSNYSSSSNFTTSPTLGTSRIVYDGSANSVNVTNLPPGQYHVAVIEYNGTNNPVYRLSDPLTGIVNVGAKPTLPATDLRFTNIDGDRISLSCDVGNGLNRMLIVKAGSAVDAWPVDFTPYTSGSSFGSGSNLGNGNFVIGTSTSNSFTVSNLTPNTTYFFAIVEVNGTGVTAFYQDPSLIVQASASTLSAPTITTSSVAANNIIGNAMQLTWTRGNGVGRIVIAKAGSPVDVLPVNLTDYSASGLFGSGSNLGNGNFVVYDGTGDNFQIQNLAPGTTYHFAFFEYNGSSGKVYLTSTIARSSSVTAPRPSVAPKNLTTTVVEGDRLTINFTKGNGTRRLVVVRKGDFVNAVPVDFTTYTTGAFGAGSQLGTGNFVTTVNAGTTTAISVSITGLEPDTQYGVAVFEMDGANGNERYLTTAYINQLVKTVSAPSIVPSSILFNALGSTSVNLSWTNGNGAGRMLVVLPSRPVTFVPVALNTHGTASGNFTSTANNLAGGHKHMYRGTATNTTLTNLSPGTTYHFALYEYNGNGQPVYNSNPLRGFFTTLPATGLAIGGFDAITFCPSQQVDVPYVSADLLNTGNQMSVELSDINGSFASPTVLGIQSTTNTSGIITSILPSSLSEGTGYRLRVRASNPNLVSPDNGTNLQIVTSVAPTFTVVGGQVTTCGAPIQLSTTQTGYNLQWFRDGAAINGQISNTLSATVSGNYQVRIAGASGGCQLFSTGTTLTITPRPTFDLSLDAIYCEGPAVNIAADALPAGGTFSGPGVSGGVFTANSAGVGQHLLSYTYIDPVSACSYREDAVVQVSARPAPPLTTGAALCGPGTLLLQASGATATDTYAWYTDASSGTALAGEITGNLSTPTLNVSTTYYAAINDGVCESTRTAVTAQINPIPSTPTASSTIHCNAASAALTATGGSDGQYRWYTTASGGTALAGEVNAVFNTPILSSSTFYYVAVNNGQCESARAAVSAQVNLQPGAPTVNGASSCGTASLTLSANGGTNGQYRWYAQASGGIAIAGEVSSTFVTPSLSSSTDYYVAVNNGSCESIRTQVIALINAVPAAPDASTVSNCGSGSITLSATGATNGQYRWYADATTATPLAGEFNNTFLTPVLSATRSYFVSINNGTCESNRTQVVAQINAIPEIPIVTGNSSCGPSSVSLGASGGNEGQYRWYTAATAGSPIPGQVNSSFVTPVITASTTYYVAINNGSCEGPRQAVTATILAVPAQPVVTSTIPVDASNTVGICNNSTILSAPAGFTYNWSNGATTREIAVSAPGIFSVVVISNDNCSSVSSTPISVVTRADCNNTPPVIDEAALTTSVDGSVTINLLSYISDAENNLNPASLRIVTQPISGASASIDASFVLTIDYEGIRFTGLDRLTIEACDQVGFCTQREITIEVIGDIVIYNAVSPNGDGKNDFFLIQHIDLFEDTRSNNVTIFNRWGDVVFEASNYDNTTRVFRGDNLNGNALPSGTYFYKIVFNSGRAMQSGYLSLRR